MGFRSPLRVVLNVLSDVGFIVMAGGAPEFYYLHMYANNGPCRRRLDDDQVDLVVEVFRMLAEGTRVRLLWALVDRELSVTELAEHVGKPTPSVSQHLAKLRMARLVRTRREGTTIFYSLENEHIRQLVTDAVFNAEHAGPGVPGHHRADAGLHALHEGGGREAGQQAEAQ